MNIESILFYSYKYCLRYWPIVLFLLLFYSIPTTAKDETQDKKPYHLQTIALLKLGDKVIPDSVPVHPVTATYNREAIIPPMCYTKTEGQYNPCYVCHQDSIKGRENTMNDADLQVTYSFSDLGMTNHWKNLFEDRTTRVDNMSDASILQWINNDNYSELANRLRKAKFSGWIPDLENLQDPELAFDEHGFANDDSHWVAFNYKPFPSTFWPTNGSTDDVMIRLANEFRLDEQGHYSRDVYLANLAIVEANIKNLDSMTTLLIDERKVGSDLNNDKELKMINKITQLDQYVGKAKPHFLQRGTYPQGTEFLHTVRYLGINEAGRIQQSRRMKEVRYMKKWVAQPLVALREFYREEAYAKDEGLLPGYTNLKHHGLDNGMGWSLQGFIEDKHGRLRVNTHEENLYCMGCHNSIGSTIDKTFAFARKVDGAQGWGYLDLHGMQDVPNMGELKGEIATYLERVGGGGEFRSNDEMKQRWFKKDGTLDHAKVANANDVYELITPSKERALKLNKAYKIIVEDQDYIYGRDAFVTSPENVYEMIDNETAPTLPEKLAYKWDIRLDWGQEQDN